MSTRLPRERKGNRGAGHDGARGLGFGRRLPGNSATPDGTLLFDLPLGDAGAGQVQLNPFYAAGSAAATFTRATPAYTVLSDGSLFQVASGVPRSCYSAAGVYLGYLAEGARTNVLLQSQTLDNASWTVSNALDMNAVAADAYVAPDGTTTMDKLQPIATTAVHSLNQAFTFTAAVYTTSIYLRYVPASPQRWVALVMNDGTTTWAASFDLLNGVAGAVSNATSTISATNNANVWRVTVTKSAAAAAAAGTVKISLNATDTATLESAARAGTETLGAWGAQLEAASFASTYIPTTTIAVTRNSDVLTYTNAGNIDDTVGTAYAEWTANGDFSSRAILMDSLVSKQIVISSSPTAAQMYDGTNASSVTVSARSVDTVYKTASKWSGSGLKIAEGGILGTLGSFTGNFGFSGIAIGASSAPEFWLFGTVRNVRLYSRAISDAQLQAMTT